MKCLVCRGACCEEAEIPLPPGFFIREWLEARGVVIEGGRSVRLETRCPKLTGEGLCSVHGTEDQPTACRVAQAGEQWCLDVVKRRRTPEQYQLIRDENDPEVL